MKFLGKWMELENIILNEVPKHKRIQWYALTDKWILAQKLRIPNIQLTDYMKLKKKEDQNVGALVFLRKGTKYSQEQLWRQSVGQRLKERPFRECLTWGFIL